MHPADSDTGRLAVKHRQTLNIRKLMVVHRNVLLLDTCLNSSDAFDSCRQSCREDISGSRPLASPWTTRAVHLRTKPKEYLPLRQLYVAAGLMQVIAWAPKTAAAVTARNFWLMTQFVPVAGMTALPAALGFTTVVYQGV